MKKVCDKKNSDRKGIFFGCYNKKKYDRTQKGTKLKNLNYYKNQKLKM